MLTRVKVQIESLGEWWCREPTSQGAPVVHRRGFVTSSGGTSTERSAATLP